MNLRSRLTLIALLLFLIAPANSSFAQEVIGPDTYPVGVNPLTGLPVSDPALLNRRPLVIKIDNYPAEIRPQSGLNSADMVWETLLAGGATRFGAIFLGEDVSHVGPVRSCRLVDFELTRIYNSLFLCSGMAQGTLDYLRADPLALSRSIVRGGPCPPLCRFPRDGVAYEHTLFVDTATARDLAVQLGRDTTPQPVTGMAFSTAPPDGVPISGIRVEYTATQIEWTYDAASGRWLRAQDGAPHLDALTGDQINAANVLILEADHIEQPFVSDGYWGTANYAFTVNLVGSGRAVLMRDGRYIEGQWRRASDADPLTYVDVNGNPLLFKPGNTFVNLVPRWADGYQLIFRLGHPLTASVTFSGGINLRQGPGAGYSWMSAAHAGDQLSAIGRNRTGDWVQLLLPNGDFVWASAALVQLDGDVMTLPLTRSTYE